MAYLKLQATVCGAITVSEGQPAGSHVDSAGYISGSTLRGALAGLWNNAEVGNEGFLDLFCRGHILFHGLFPVPAVIHKQFYDSNWFPYRIPLSAFECKYDRGFINEGGHNFVDQAIPKPEKEKKCKTCKAPLKQVRSTEFYYWNLTEKAIHSKKEIYIYHGTERSTRRAEDAALYSYESFCDGETFVGWLSGSETDIQTFKKKLPTVQDSQTGEPTLRLHVGRGRKRRGYLSVTIKEPAKDHRLYPLPGITKDNRLVVVLQTPAILYDNLFRNKTTLDVADIFKDRPGGMNIQKYDGIPDYSSLVSIDGWSGVHGLPRMPEKALAAGSTFAFSHDPVADQAAKKQLQDYLIGVQDRGIGERRNDGFGQIIINPPLNCPDAEVLI